MWEAYNEEEDKKRTVYLQIAFGKREPKLTKGINLHF